MQSSSVLFVICGRLGPELVRSFVEPVFQARKYGTIVLFADSTIDGDDSVKFVRPPSLLRRRKMLRPLLMAYDFFSVLILAMRYRPSLVWGIYTLPSGLFGFLISRLVGCQCMISVIGGVIEIKTYFRGTRFWERLNVFLLKQSDAVTVMGSQVRSYLLAKNVREDKIHTYVGGIKTEKYFQVHIAKDIDILYLGRLTENKGILRFIEIIRGIRGKYPGIKAVVVGTGEDSDRARQRAAELNVSDTIVFKGYVEETTTYFQRSRLFVLPSSSEGLSMATREAMACGCVSVVSDVGSMRDIADHGKTAIVIRDFRDVEEYITACTSLLNNTTTMEDISRNASEMILRGFSYRSQIDAFTKIYIGLRNV